MQLLHLRTEDILELVAWLKRAQDRFTSPTIQNEVLEIMALAVLRKLTGRISGRQYAILVDERQIICHQHYKGRRCQLVMDKVL